MKKLTVFIPLLFLSFVFSFAQTDTKAKAILDKTVKQMQEGATKSNFELVIEDAKTEKKDKVKGSIYMKGQKFKIMVPAVHTYFDGKAQYVYVLKNKEVTITNPTNEEIAEVNPAYFLTSYSKQSTIQFSMDNKPELTYHIIDIFPDYNQKKDYYKIIVHIDKKTGNLMSVRVRGRSGVHSTITLKNVSTKLKLDDSFFAFDFIANPKVIKNDLR